MRIVLISGASGAGKTTLQEELLERLDAGRVISNTTRPRREADKADEYRHLSKNEFRTLQDFLWTQEIHGNFYGTRDADVRIQLEKHGTAIIIGTVVCHSLLRKYYMCSSIEISSLHILSPDEAELKRRLMERGDCIDDIKKRIHDCREWDNEAKRLSFIKLIHPGPKQHVLDTALEILEEI